MSIIQLVKLALGAFDDERPTRFTGQSFSSRPVNRRGGAYSPLLRDRIFVNQVACVAARLRCAFLVDSVNLSQAEADHLSRHLTRRIPQLLVLYEGISEQVFITHRELLNHRLEEFQRGDEDDLLQNISFVDVQTTEQPCLLRQPPTSFTVPLRRLLNDLKSASQDVAMLAVSLVDVPSHMTAIAAWMLEYPVAYVVDNMPGKQQNNCLGGLPLWLCKIRLSSSDDDASFDLLAFSVPQRLEREAILSTNMESAQSAASIGSVHELAIRLQGRYQARLLSSEGISNEAVSTAGSSKLSTTPRTLPWTSATVALDVVTLDRVAL